MRTSAIASSGVREYVAAMFVRLAPNYSGHEQGYMQTDAGRSFV
jgi:hypothetical protein